MILIAFAWLYVVLMVAVVEATGSDGTLLGAIVTFLLYGVLPLSIVLYLMLSPARRSVRRAAEAALPDATPESTAGAGIDPDQRGHAAGDSVAAERKEP